MARQRFRKRTWMVAGVAGVVMGAAGLWYYHGRSSPHRSSPVDGGPVPLTGERALVGPAGPALKQPPTDPNSRRSLSTPGSRPANRGSEAHADRSNQARPDLPAPRSPGDTVPPAATRPAADPDPAQAKADFRAGLAARDRRDLLAARDHLNLALRMGLPPDNAETARQSLADLAQRTLFSGAVVEGDPLAQYHKVRLGESLGRIARQFQVTEDLLAHVNEIPNKHQIREGQRIKVLRGPFHAVLDKSDHVLHVYLQDLYVRTFRVALGSNGGTPTGRWKVVNRQENPDWTDPRTGQKWHQDDPRNPVGEYWIGLEGLEGEAVGQFGFGIHGTIEPETIGQDVSLGCVRLADDDIRSVYRMLVPGHSVVTVEP